MLTMTESRKYVINVVITAAVDVKAPAVADDVVLAVLLKYCFSSCACSHSQWPKPVIKRVSSQKPFTKVTARDSRAKSCSMLSSHEHGTGLRAIKTHRYQHFSKELSKHHVL